MIAPDAKGQSTHSEMFSLAADRVSQGDHRFVYIAFVQRELFVRTPQVQGCRFEAASSSLVGVHFTTQPFFSLQRFIS